MLSIEINILKRHTAKNKHGTKRKTLDATHSKYLGFLNSIENGEETIFCYIKFFCRLLFG